MNIRALARLWLARRRSRTAPVVVRKAPQLNLETLEGRLAPGDVLVSIAALTAFLAPAAADTTDLSSQNTESTVANDVATATPPPPTPDLNPTVAASIVSGGSNNGGSASQSSMSNPINSILPELAGMLASNTATHPYEPMRNTSPSGGGGSSAGSASAPHSGTSAGTGSSSTGSASTILPPPSTTGAQTSQAAASTSNSTTSSAGTSSGGTSATGSLGTTAASASGVTATPAISATPVNNGPSSAKTTSTTNAQLSILLPSYTSSSTPTITVEGDSSMNFLNTPVRIDIDYQQDGSFSDAGDKNVPVQVVSIGGANDNEEVLTLPTLANGTWGVRARVGTASAVASVGVNTPVDLSGQSVLFEPNLGQSAAGVDYVSIDNNYTTFLTNNGMVLSLANEGQGTSTLQMQVVKANVAGETTQLLQQAPGLTNYLLGNDPAGWTTNIPSYYAVQYTNIYANVNLTYTGNHGDVEYEFTVLPGNSPSAIRLNYVLGSSAANSTAQILPNGDLVLLDTSTFNSVVVPAPTIYEVDSKGNQTPVQGGYLLNANGSIGFTVGTYNTSDSLVIDPTLEFSTFFGGGSGSNEFDSGQGIAADTKGNSYVAGYTTGASATDFPLTSTTLPATENGNVGSTGGTTGFVAKFSPTGTPIYTTFLGGTGANANQEANAIAVDSSGNAYVAGGTDQTNFPVMNAAQTTNKASAGTGGETTDTTGEFGAGGITNAFLSVLNANGDGLIYSTYYGGDGTDVGIMMGDEATGVALSGTTAYITGYTDSANLTTTAGGVQPALTPAADDGSSFIAAFNTTGTGTSSLLYATYIGGNNDTTIATAIATDASGDVYVTGNTDNTVDFHLSGAIGQTFNSTTAGGTAAFVMELNSSLSAYMWNELLSGNGSEVGEALTVNSADDVYVTGTTLSNNFPVTAGAYDTAYPPAASGTSGLTFATTVFVTEIAAGGAGLVFSTYLGGNDLAGYPIVNDYLFTVATDIYGYDPLLNNNNGYGENLDYGDTGFGIALDSSGDVYVAGATLSQNFPVTDSSVYQPNVASYGFLTVFNPTGSALIYSTLLGATANISSSTAASGTVLTKVAVDSSNNIYVTGSTGDGNFSTTTAAFSTTYTGSEYEAVVAKYNNAVAPPTPPTPPTPPSGGGSSTGSEASLYPEDRFEPNETEDAATNFGVLAAGAANSQTQSDLTVNIHSDGLPDYDWYTWTAATAGTFTAQMTVSQAGTPSSQLELHLFTVNSNDTLVADGTTDVGLSATGSVSVQLTAGESIYVEVKGVNSSPGYRTQGVYSLTAELS